MDRIFSSGHSGPATLIQKVRNFLTRNGVPRFLYADEGSAYESMEFCTFCEEWGIKLITCSGEYPQGNGTAEAAVKRVKKWLSGANSEDELARAILAWHQTPIASGRPTPAQLHLGRNVRDEITNKIKKSQVNWDEVQLWKQSQKSEQAAAYNKRAKDLPELQIGDPVFVSMHGQWLRGIIEQYADRPRSFRIKMSDTGARVERNRVHLRLDKTKTNTKTDTNLYYFSADHERPTESDEPTCQGREEPEPGSHEDRHDETRSRVPDASPPTSEAYTPAESARTNQKKPRLDREAKFLKKPHTSRYGRDSKKVVK